MRLNWTKILDPSSLNLRVESIGGGAKKKKIKKKILTNTSYL